MAYDLSQLHRIRIRQESTFATDMTSAGTSFTSFLDLPIRRGTFQGGRAEGELDPMTNKQRIDQFDEQVRGAKTCAPQWEMLLHSHGTPILGNVAAPTSATWAQGLVLKTMLGGERTETPQAAPTTVQAGSSATIINVTAGHGARFVKGCGIAVVLNGRIECNEVLSVSTDAISVKVAFSGTPANGTAVYGSTTYYPTDPTGLATSLQIAYEGRESSHRFGYLGCNGNFTLGLTNRELLTMNVQMQGASWLKYGTAALAAASFTNFQPIVLKDSIFVVGTVGSTTRNVVNTFGREIAPNLKYVLVQAEDGIEGYVGQKRVHEPPVLSGKISTYRDGSGFDWDAAQTARSDLALFHQYGSVAGGAVLITAPTVQTWVPDDPDADGVQGIGIPWKARNDSAVGTPTSDFDFAAMRMHFF